MFRLWFPQYWSTLRKLIWLKAGVLASEVWKTVSGAIVAFTTKIAAPVRSLVVAIDPVQSGSGDPSPDNVRPISGWTGCSIQHRGKNLFNKNSYSSVPQSYFQTVGGTISYSSTRIVVYIPCKPNTKYTLQKIRQVDNDRFYGGWTEILPAVGVNVYGVTAAPNGGTVGTKSTITIETGATAKYLVCWLSWGATTPTVFDPEVASFQIEVGSTATDYEAFSGQTYSITFPDAAGTVYGGTLDVTNGVLTVTRAKQTFTWGTGGTSLGSYTRKSMGIGTNASGGTIGNRAICTVAPYNPNYTGDFLHFYIDGTQMLAYLPNETAADLQFDVVYFLKTPQTYQLTPLELRTLLGSNTIWADAGDVTVEYRES